MRQSRYVLLFVLGVITGIVGLLTIQIFQKYYTQEYVVTFDTTGIVASIVNIVKSSTTSVTNPAYTRFDELYQILSDIYYSGDAIDSGKMIQAARKAFVDALGDPYTVYLDAVENKELFDALQGTTDFEGIGAYISKRDQGIQIDEVIKDSPAFKAGLQPLDIIVQISGEVTKSMSIGEAVSKIRGPKGTQVKLMILRTNSSGEQELLEKVVTRDKITISSIKSNILTGAGNRKIGHIQILSVGEETESLFAKEVKYLVLQGISGLILDMRGNGGGLLDIAVAICSHFLPKGEVVVTAKHRAYKDETYVSKGPGELGHLPIVVLVDTMTASAGEIIALALKDQLNATIVGTKTFGKGSIQTLHEFEDKSSLKVTIGKWYSPSGKNIDRIGVTPDVEVPFDMTGYSKNLKDNQLQKAIEILNQKF